MLGESSLCSEHAIAASNAEMVGDALLCVLHEVQLGTVTRQSVVRPKGAAQKPHATEISNFVVQERDPRAARGRA